MSNNVYSSIKNTMVQPSQLNGGNLANIFDLQILRTVKARVDLNTDNPPQYYTVVNEYDSSPVVLGNNDFIIGYCVGNGNISKVPHSNIVELPYTPAPITPITNSPQIKFVINPIPPEYNTLLNKWIPQNPTGLGVQIVTPTFTTGNVNQNGLYINSGYGEFGSVITNSCGITSWLQMNQTVNVFTIENGMTTAGSINIILIIMTI